MLLYLLIPVLAAACFFCVSLSLLVHLTDFFFFTAFLRYSCILLLLLISFFIIFFLYKILKSNQSKLNNLCSKKWMIIFLVAALIISSILVFFFPRPKIPTSHTLIISVPLPDDGGVNTIKISNIRKILDAPEPGSAYVNFNDVIVRNGEVQIEDENLYLNGPSEISYESYFSGCMSVFFETSPESHLVDIQFDQVKERYSLYSMDNLETEVRLCAPLSIDRLSAKWQMIVIFLYISDAISIFSALILVSLVFYFLFLSRSDRSKRTLAFIVPVLFAGITLFASAFQVYEIIRYPDVVNEMSPPTKPAVLEEDINFHHIYQETLHTKKFAHSFIMTFLDIYPGVGSVYIHQDTLDAFNFSSFEFQRWFEVFNPQPMDNCPIEISDTDLATMVDSGVWLRKEIDLEARDKTFFVNYPSQDPEEFILITYIGNDFYFIPDSMISNIKEVE